MSQLFSSIFFSFLLLFQTSAIAEEADIEPLAVPEEVHEVSVSPEENSNEASVSDETSVSAEENSNEVSTEETADISTEVEVATNDVAEAHSTVEEMSGTEEMSHTEEPETVEPTQEVEEKIEEVPSEEELEAKHAEETELREVGAGEEPIIEE